MTPESMYQEVVEVIPEDDTALAIRAGQDLAVNLAGPISHSLEI